MISFRFKSAGSLWLTLVALGILGFPAFLWLIGNWGDCIVSSSASYCNNIPDIFAHVLFGFYVFFLFGGWMISAFLVLAAIILLGWAVYLERAARRGPKH